MIEDTVLNRNDFVESLCTKLTTWVTSEKDASFFKKTNKQSKFSCGDITTSRDSVFWMSKIHFTVKYGYKNASFDKFLLPSENDVMCNIWENAVKRAGEDKLPVLVYKKPYMASYIFITHDLYGNLIKDLLSVNMLRVRYMNAPDAYVFEMNEFFTNVKYKSLKKVVNQL